MNFAEFFAGVGLVREGLTQDGWECWWANDICEDKSTTYRLNFGNDDIHTEDIWEIVRNPDVIPNDIFMYTASFPCTDLSEAGGRRGLEGEESGTLHALLEILRNKIVSQTAPKVVMLENVKGFLTSNGGDDVAFTVKALNDLGYLVDIIELDAVFFRPQSRPRVFVIAIESALAAISTRVKEPNQAIDDWWIHFDQEPELHTESIENIIRNNDDLGWCLTAIQTPNRANLQLDNIIETEITEDSPLWWSQERIDKLYNQMSYAHQERLHLMMAGDQFSYGTVYRRMRKGKSMAEMRTDGIAGCLRTPRGGSSKQILVRAGNGQFRVRLLSPREYARLQGVRDTFQLPENANKGYFAMGDAVCVQAIEHISNQVLVNLFNTYQAHMSEAVAV